MKWLVVSYGLGRPMSIAVSPSPILTIIGLPMLLAVCTSVGVLLSSRRNVTRSVWLASIALLVWVFPGGTIDDWLIVQRPVAGPPNGMAYPLLLLDYAIGALLFVIVLYVGASAKESGSFARGLHLRQFFGKSSQGLLTLGVTSLAALFIMWPLMGAAVAASKRLQVFFAVITAFALASMITKNLLEEQHTLWYWLAPFVVGVLGVVVATLSPAMSLPATYQHIDTLPAWWAVRPLPFEMLAGGWIGVIMGLGLEKPTEELEQPSL